MNLINLLWNKWDHIRYWNALRQFSPVETLIDIGCGNSPQGFIEVTERHYTVDPAIHSAGEGYFHINGTWDTAMSIMRNNPVHTVVLMDVVEHLEKAEAKRLLAQTQEYVQQIVVFTPLGFMPQEDGEWNTHRSGWNEQDFAGWEQHVFEHFHWCDFKGRVYEKPWPAVLAVWRK